MYGAKGEYYCICMHVFRLYFNSTFHLSLLMMQVAANSLIFSNLYGYQRILLIALTRSLVF